MEKLEIIREGYGPVSGDCTQRFRIKLNRGCTLGEFIRAVLATYAGEWGYIEVPMRGLCKYRRGKIEGSSFGFLELESEINPDTIKASGGWSAMDYRVELLQCEDE